MEKIGSSPIFDEEPKKWSQIKYVYSGTPGEGRIVCQKCITFTLQTQAAVQYTLSCGLEGTFVIPAIGLEIGGSFNKSKTTQKAYTPIDTHKGYFERVNGNWKLENPDVTRLISLQK